MGILKREKWTESDITALPTGEHDYFERKAGALLSDKNGFLDTVAKALAAFANSGGGHLVLGVDDNGVFDGLPAMEGRARLRDWVEQKAPYLLSYELQDFRVHQVIPDAISSSIPPGRILLVIDVGDSALAPHQSTRDERYYFRQGGHSVPAPHHYLELLRQRVFGPSLTATVTSVDAGPSYADKHGTAFTPFEATFDLQNNGSLAAYKWRLYARQLEPPEGWSADEFNFDPNTFPLKAGQTVRQGSLDLGDHTILPGLSARATIRFGVSLGTAPLTEQEVQTRVEQLLKTRIGYRVATEVSAGEDQWLYLNDYFVPDALHAQIANDIGIP